MSSDALPLLSIRGVGKTYAQPVLAEIDLQLFGGEVLALTGENGAGKSTLSKIVGGLERPGAGSLELLGRPYAPASRREAEALGVRMVMQELNLLPTLSVAENLFLHDLPRRAGWIDRRRLRAAAREAMAQVGLEAIDPDTLVGDLGIGHQQMVEIARNLIGDCRLLILDEPTAMLTAREVDMLFEQVERLRERGVAIVYISHRLEELARISQRIAVLRDGRLVCVEPIERYDADRLVTLMVGRDLGERFDLGTRQIGAPLLRVERLSRRGKVHEVSFEVRAGEIFGISGLIGSGRTELLRLIYGADRADGGQVLLGDPPQRLSLRSPADSVRQGVALITEDRKGEGLLLDHPALALVAESPLFGQRVMQRRRREKTRDGGDAVIKNLTELREGAPVVHIDHGVGRYLGLITLEVDNQQAEFLMLQYAEDAKLYVPVANLHLIARYTGADDALAPLHRLGSETWQKAKRKAAEQVRDVAAELLDIYARRAAREGFAFKDPQADYATFSAGFPFEETPDQQGAIEAVVADMLAPRPMDRLVCGDVGFGKTEVAMRAAFVAVHSGKQVAVLVPTTLLAQQHYNSFRDRFADWTVSVEVMSRFMSAKEVENAARLLAEGKIDILIGTHKLLQEDVKFANLGLVVIDEEHRFGVRQKEQLKALRSEVDILTLTATPIPRTLNMAVSGMRDLSIIATPPARRLSVRTFVMEQQNAVIKEALLRELLRGGQVYYLHNEVKTIEKCARDLAELVPEARIGIGHGQMHERELEQVMSDFYHKRFNVLVASTIIETGIDVPSANTILIERADKFGLAQLHQLRGRVGRSHHQAYAYLLTPPRRQMTPDAEKRLEAIANAQDLGAGFVLATHDLEIRGAGELLGDGQSGQIQAVGFTLYMEMLERAVKAIRKGEQPNLEQPLGGGPEVNLRVPALIPEDYLPDVHARLILYKRIANAPDEEGLRELQVEMIDRFGLLPDPAKNLMRLTLLKLQAEKLGILKVDAGPQGGRIEFAADTQVDPLVLIKLIQGQPNRYKFEGATLFRFQVPMERPEERFNTLEALFERLTPQTT